MSAGYWNLENKVCQARFKMDKSCNGQNEKKDEVSWNPTPDPEFTCYKFNFSSPGKPLTIDLQSRTTQEPEEMFDLYFKARQLAHDYNRYSYGFELKFHNKLHEISNDYYYEIVLRVSHLLGVTCRVQTLISVANKRHNRKITNKGNFDLEDIGHVDHYTLYICRYKDSNVKQNAKKGDSIGSMLWRTGAYSDISLIVGDKILRVHKEVLSQKSEVFKKMFSHEMSETQNGIVKIDDLDTEVVEEILSFVYTERAGNIAKMPRELFEAAHKYELHELQSLCEEHFIFSLNYQNAIDILEIANLYDLEVLRKGVKGFIENHEEDMVHESSYRSFLCKDLKIENAVGTLLLADRNALDDVKIEVLKFIKEHDKEMMERAEFLELFKSQPSLMRKVFEYIYEKVVEIKLSDYTFITL